MKRSRVGGAEQDAFSQVLRRWQQWRPGERKWVKRKANKRERREWRARRGEDQC